MKDLAGVVSGLLKFMDEEPDREGLKATPQRFKRFIEEFLAPEPLNIKPSVFPSENYDDMIIQTRIPFYSICEHHLIPFFGYGAIAYIPGSSLVGLSELARILDRVSRRLQNQERITVEVANLLNKTVKPKGVGVILTARHLCMEMRGIQKPEVLTTTSCLRGSFRSDSKTRAEFIELVEAAKAA